MDFVDAFYWFDSKTFGKNDNIYTVGQISI